MPLTKKQKRKVKRQLDPTYKCAKCGSKDYSADLTTLPLVTTELGQKGKSVLALVVGCEGCGFIELHSAKCLGL